MIVKQAANVVELLEFFAERGRPATLAEIADGLGWPRSSTFNLISTFVAKGYFYEPRARGGYYPSLWWRRVVNAIADAEPLPEAVEALAQEVAKATGETACVAAPAGLSALLVYAVESRQPIRFSPWLGERNPIQASASGRALISLLSATEKQSLFRKLKFEKHTPQTVASVAELEAELRAAETRGYHQSEAEFVEDLISIAVPVPINGRMLAVVVAGPMFRCQPRAEEIGQLLRAAADKLNAKL